MQRGGVDGGRSVYRLDQVQAADTRDQSLVVLLCGQIITGGGGGADKGAIASLFLSGGCRVYTCVFAFFTHTLDRQVYVFRSERVIYV